jgi:uncharacterized protein YaaQ
VKLIYAIIHEKDSENMTEILIKHGHTVTRMASTGGFVRYGNITLLIGVKPESVDEVFALLREHCSPTPPNQHAATVFVLDLPVYRKQ